MKINPISQYNPSFQSIHVYDQHAQRLILDSVNLNQYNELKDIFSKQANNVVNCYLYRSKNEKNLRARIMCQYFINNFKEHYKQFPIFESKLDFIKRLSKQMDKYQNQLNKAGAKNLK